MVVGARALPRPRAAARGEDEGGLLTSGDPPRGRPSEDQRHDLVVLTPGPDTSSSSSVVAGRRSPGEHAGRWRAEGNRRSPAWRIVRRQPHHGRHRSVSLPHQNGPATLIGFAGARLPGVCAGTGRRCQGFRHEPGCLFGGRGPRARSNNRPRWTAFDNIDPVARGRVRAHVIPQEAVARVPGAGQARTSARVRQAAGRAGQHRHQVAAPTPTTAGNGFLYSYRDMTLNARNFFDRFDTGRRTHLGGEAAVTAKQQWGLPTLGGPRTEDPDPSISSPTSAQPRSPDGAGS
jgi:hypothetical protein